MSRPRATMKEKQTVTNPEEGLVNNSNPIRKICERDVRVRIRSGPGVGFDHVNGEYLGPGVFEIDEIASGTGSMSGWGHLVNGKGWIALDFVDIVD